jgi:hypothetical protein
MIPVLSGYAIGLCPEKRGISIQNYKKKWNNQRAAAKNLKLWIFCRLYGMDVKCF